MFRGFSRCILRGRTEDQTRFLRVLENQKRAVVKGGGSQASTFKRGGPEACIYLSNYLFIHLSIYLSIGINAL